MNPKDKARRHVRIALLIGLLAPGYEYFMYVLTSSGALFYRVGVMFGLIGFLLFVPLVWFFGLAVIQLVSTIFHAVFGRGVPCALWHEAVFTSLWTLPIAAVLGVVTWLVYSLGEFGGWPDDVVFGTVANVIGAWCYCTIFWSWFRLRRERSYST